MLTNYCNSSKQCSLHRRHQHRHLLAALSKVDASALGLNIVSNGLQQPLSWAAVEHAQHTGVCLGGKELEDGQHAAGTDVLAVQETKGIGCRGREEGAGESTRGKERRVS